jgi:hypothetical protein
MRAEKGDEEPVEQQLFQDDDEDDEDLPKDEPELNKTSAAVRLNAIVGAATFLSNADPSCKEKMVLIVKKEFSDFSGYVSIPYKVVFDTSKKLLCSLYTLHLLTTNFCHTQ